MMQPSLFHPSLHYLSSQPKQDGKTRIKANHTDTNVQIRTRASQIQFDILWSNEASYSVITVCLMPPYKHAQNSRTAAPRQGAPIQSYLPAPLPDRWALIRWVRACCTAQWCWNQVHVAFFWGGGVSITAWENAKLESACRARTRVDARVWCEHQSSSLSVSEQCSGSEKRTEEFAVVWRAWSPRADIAVYWNAVSPLQRVPFPLSAGTHAHAWYAHWAAGVALIQIPSLQKNVQAQSPTVPAVPVKAHKVIEILPCDLRLITIICPAPPQSASDWTLIPEGATSGKTLQLAVISFKALNATDNRAKHRDGCSGPVLCVLLE